MWKFHIPERIDHQDSKFGNTAKSTKTKENSSKSDASMIFNLSDGFKMQKKDFMLLKFSMF